MSLVALFWVLQSFALFACLFAFVKGGAAERIAAGIIVANGLIAAVIETTLPHSIVQISQISLDALSALALLVITLRYASIWLGVVMLLYAAQFALHAFYLVTERSRDMFHFLANNVASTAIMIALIGGTVVHWRRQRSAARQIT